jgi:hypothetical protein
LGLSGYYRSFIKEYAISRQLNQLTTDVNFEWAETQQLSFDKLKEALTSESDLANPRFDLPFILSCEASKYDISVMLSQLQNGQERPISFASGMLNKAEKNYSTTYKQRLAVAFGTRLHRCLVHGKKFKIVTDHAAHKWIITVWTESTNILTEPHNRRQSLLESIPV